MSDTCKDINITMIPSAAIRDNLKSATKSKVVFGSDYQMYMGYCAQWYFKDGIRIRPISYDEYMNLTVSTSVV